MLRNQITLNKMKRKLKDIATILSGTYQKECPEGDVLYLQVKDLRSLYLESGKLKPTVQNTPRLAKYILQDEDLLFAAKGTSNFCALYNKAMGMAIASSAFFIIRVYLVNILPEYICWYLNSPQIIELLQACAVGSNTPSITKPMLEEIEIPIPSIEEQKKVLTCKHLQNREYELQLLIAEKQKRLIDQILINIINK